MLDRESCGEGSLIAASKHNEWNRLSGPLPTGIQPGYGTVGIDHTLGYPLEGTGWGYCTHRSSSRPFSDFQYHWSWYLSGPALGIEGRWYSVVLILLLTLVPIINDEGEKSSGPSVRCHKVYSLLSLHDVPELGYLVVWIEYAVFIRMLKISSFISPSQTAWLCHEYFVPLEARIRCNRLWLKSKSRLSTFRCLDLPVPGIFHLDFWIRRVASNRPKLHKLRITLDSRLLLQELWYHNGL